MDTVTVTESTPQWADAAAASADAETERKAAARPPRTFTEQMPCALTEPELEELKAKILRQYDEIETIDEERKAVNSGFRARMNLIKESIRENRVTLQTKKELRDVELVEEFLFATNTVRVTRADTNEVVRERAMTRGERQEELPLEMVDGTSLLDDEDDGIVEDDYRPDADDDLPDFVEPGEITDPGAVLAGSTSDEKPAKGKAKKPRKGKKS